jgi:hypothetical protein
MASPTANFGFSYNGWLFGGTGQGVQVLSVTGLEDLPTLRVQDDNRGYFDGMFTGRDFLNGRTITMELQIMSDGSNNYQVYLQQLQQYLISQQSGTTVLQFNLPTRGTRRVNARVRRRAIAVNPEYTYGKAYATIEFFCPDPRIYNDTATTYTFTPASGTGRTYPRVYPMLYNATTGTPGNQQTMVNNGNYTTYPIYTIVGPCSNPSIVNANTGTALNFNVTLASTDTLTVDTDMKTVLLNNVVSRNLLAAGSQWSGFDPGNTLLSLLVSTYTAGASMVVSYRDAYI